MEEKNHIKHGKNIGESIRRYRRLSGLTLDGLALKAGLNASHLWKIENNMSNPRPKTLQKIQKAFDDLGVEVSQEPVKEHETVVIVSTLSNVQKQVVLKLVDMFNKNEIPAEFIHDILRAVEKYNKNKESGL